MTDRELAQALARAIVADIRAEPVDPPSVPTVVTLKPKNPIAATAATTGESWDSRFRSA